MTLASSGWTSRSQGERLALRGLGTPGRRWAGPCPLSRRPTPPRRPLARTARQVEATRVAPSDLVALEQRGHSELPVRADDQGGDDTKNARRTPRGPAAARAPGGIHVAPSASGRARQRRYEGLE